MKLAQLGLTTRDIDLGGIDAEADYKLDEYFLKTAHVEAVLRGRRTLFLGRKGSGKSALFTQLSRLTTLNGLEEVKVLLITPDMYSWAAMRSYEEQGILPELAHTNAWKLTISIELASLLVSVDAEWSEEAEQAVRQLRQFLTENFGTHNPGWTNAAAAVLKGLRSFNLSAFGFGIGLERDQANAQPMTPTIVNTLLNTIASITAQQGVIIALDRLDDSWDGEPESHSLMVGLLKASKEINDFYGADDSATGIRVVVFLRSDIYDSLQFDDKDKHRPTEEHITWSASELKAMLQLRLPAGVSVDEVFEDEDMRGGATPFNYIVRRTFLRPREILQFMEESLRQSGEGASEITSEDIRQAEVRYSRWKVNDLKQEYSKVFPDYSILLECLRQETHRYDSINELQLLLETKQPSLLAAHSIRVLLDMLFESSVIGVRLRNAGSPRFRCQDADLALPSAGAVYVHPSLYRGLNIREARRQADVDRVIETGSTQDRVTIELLGIMMASLPIQDLTFLGLKPTPLDVFRNLTFADCARSLGIEISIDEQGDVTRLIIRPVTLFVERYNFDSRVYEELRTQMIGVLTASEMTVEAYEAGERSSRR